MNESVHSVTEGVARSDVEARRTDLINLASKFAPSNSSRGVVCSVLDRSYSGLGCHKVNFELSGGMFCSKIHECDKSVVRCITESVELMVSGLFVSQIKEATGYSDVL